LQTAFAPEFYAIFMQESRNATRFFILAMTPERRLSEAVEHHKGIVVGGSKLR
jgi:hypothetical protein